MNNKEILNCSDIETNTITANTSTVTALLDSPNILTRILNSTLPNGMIIF